MPRFAYSFCLLLLVAACDCSSSPGDLRSDSGADGDQGDGSIDGANTDSSGQDTSRGDTNNGSDDECGNGLDDDEDGQVDERCACSPGEVQECYVGNPEEAGNGICVRGSQACEANFEFANWEACIGSGAPEEEVCDDVDNDCDGVTDEGCACRVGDLRECYTGPEGTEGIGYCAPGAERCIDRGTGPEWTACMGSAVPGTEDCNGGDEDCDGLIDEGCDCTVGDSRSCYGGAPGTEGVGSCRPGRQDCVASGTWSECTGDATGSSELCSGGVDEDCDGDIDCDDSDCNCCTAYAESLPVVPPEAEILLLVDRSGSMQWPASGTTRSRWQELESAMSTTLPMLSSTDLGLLTFPTANGTNEQLYCGVASTPHVPLGPGNAGSINSYLSSNPPRAGDTPTPDAVMNARSYFAGRSSSLTPFVILATDGLPEPNCGATVPATVSAISALQGDGVDTFVVGIVGPDRDGDTSGIPALRAALNQFADAGGRPRTGSIRYYEAVDGAALTRAMQSILGAATDCRFTFPSTPPAGAQILQDGVAVPASGYSLSGSTVTFSGAYCDRIRAGLVMTVSARLSC